MARPWLEVQRDLNHYLSMNRDGIKHYKAEMEAMMRMPDKTDEEQALRFHQKQQIVKEHASLLRPGVDLLREYETAYHEQVHPTRVPDLLHQTKMIDLDHPDNPYGERTLEGWKPGGKDGRVYVPGGHQESPKVIVLPK